MGYIVCFILLFGYFIIDSSGHPSRNVGIIGGHHITIKDAPFMASVHVVNVGALCGGSIVHERFILTAAHCVYRNHTYRILVGTDDVDNGGDWYDVEKMITHEEYNAKMYTNDISLYKLKTPIKFGRNVAKVDLPTADLNIKKGTLLNTTGWGWTKPSGDPSKVLLQVAIPMVLRKTCNRIYNPMFIKITSKMMCAGVGGKDSCQGDSGGPLTLKNVQVGVVSFGAMCGDNPGIYTKVSSYLSWIDQTIRNNI